MQVIPIVVGSLRIVTKTLHRLLGKLDIKISASLLKKMPSIKGYANIRCFRMVWLRPRMTIGYWIIVLAALRMWVGKEYMLYLLGWSLSQVLSQGEWQGWKEWTRKVQLGEYSVNCLGGFGILEANLYLMDETENTCSLSQESPKNNLIHENNH